MRLFSWNLNGRASSLADQVAAVGARSPDIVALQEVTTRSAPVLASELALRGLPHAIDSFALAPTNFVAVGPRRYGLLVASRFALEPLPLGTFDLPWPERLLSARVLTPGGPVELHTTHVPPGSGNGWIKIEMLTGLYRGLACSSAVPRILCGDFNLPQSERSAQEIVTWAQRVRPNGQIVCRARVRGGAGASWDAAERNIVIGLAAYDLPDVFRALHGYETPGSVGSCDAGYGAFRVDSITFSRPPHCTHARVCIYTTSASVASVITPPSKRHSTCVIANSEAAGGDDTI